MASHKLPNCCVALQAALVTAAYLLYTAVLGICAPMRNWPFILPGGTSVEFSTWLGAG